MPSENAKDVRYSLILDASTRSALAAVAKTYKITQGEVIQGLLSNMNPVVMTPIFEKLREAKIAARAPKKDLLARLKSLTPEQIEAIKKMSAGN